MLPPELPEFGNPASEEQFEAHLTALIAELPPQLLHNLRVLLAGCSQSALSLWREANVDPEGLAEIEGLTGLSEERIRRMNELEADTDYGRLLLTTPCRLHAVATLGLALFNTPLLARFTAFMNEPGRLSDGAWDRIQEAATDIGQRLIERLEAHPSGEFFDLEDLLTERTNEAYEARRYTGEDLRLRRLQLEGIVARLLTSYEATTAETAAIEAPTAPEWPARAANDPEHPQHTFYHGPLLETNYLAPQITMLLLATTLPQTLLLLPDHPYGRAVRKLRWLHHAPWLQQLNARLGTLREETPIEMSFTELMILYQGSQLVALALVQEVLPEIDRQLTALWEQMAGDDETADAMPFPHLSRHFSSVSPADAEYSPSRLVCGMVEGFVALLRRAFNDFAPDDAETAAYQRELAETQAEFDEFAGVLLAGDNP